LHGTFELKPAVSREGDVGQRETAGREQALELCPAADAEIRAARRRTRA